MVATSRNARILLSIGALVAALVVAELLARAFAPAATNLRFEQDTAELRDMNLHAATSIIQSDPDRFWRLKPNTRLPGDAWPFSGVIANSQSFRELIDTPKAKAPGTYRILFLGDSCTFGYGVQVERTFAQVTERTLAGRHPQRNVESINAGVPGYSLFQGWRVLEDEGLGYDPDLVVLNFGWNDYGLWDHRSDLEHYADALAARPPAPLRKSRLAQLTWSSLRSRPAPKDAAKRPRLLPQEFAELLGRIHALTSERGIKLLILSWSMRGNTDAETPAEFRTELQTEMLRFGAAHETADTIDLVPMARDLVQERGVESIYFDNGHMTAFGHAAVAAKIVPWIERNGGL